MTPTNKPPALFSKVSLLYGALTDKHLVFKPRNTTVLLILLTIFN